MKFKGSFGIKCNQLVHTFFLSPLMQKSHVWLHWNPGKQRAWSVVDFHSDEKHVPLLNEILETQDQKPRVSSVFR